MGLIRTTIKLSNPTIETSAPIEVVALVDTGALHLCLPEHVALQLNLRELEKREVILADGKRQFCAYCGPVKVQFQKRQCFVGAMVMGDEVLLGAIPMEDMDVLIHPATQQLVINPANPNFAVSTVK